MLKDLGIKSGTTGASQENGEQIVKAQNKFLILFQTAMYARCK